MIEVVVDGICSAISEATGFRVDAESQPEDKFWRTVQVYNPNPIQESRAVKYCACDGCEELVFD